MAPPFRPLVSTSSAEGSGASNGMFISLHGFLTDMWGSHRGAAAHSIAARAADTYTLSASAEARLNQRFDKVLVFATVAVMVQLVVVFAMCLVLVSASKRRRAGIMRSATV